MSTAARMWDDEEAGKEAGPERVDAELCYKNNKHGFYVYAKLKKCDPDTVVRYIGRYLGRATAALSRIDSYDGETVTFHYNRHEDNAYVPETLSVLDFIWRLIRHIPEKYFKMIRCSGLYAA